MINDQKRELDRFFDMKNHKMTIKPLLISKIEEIEYALVEIGKRIIESNLSEADRYNEFIQER